MEGSGDVEREVNAIMVLELIVCVIGVIANITVMTVIVILREYRKTLTHWYVLQLAIADCAFLLTIPFTFVEEHKGEWPFTNGMCKAKETVLFFNYHSSILFLVVMSLDRYIAVCHARSNVFLKFRSRRASHIITVTVWGLSLIFCIPIMSYSTKMADAPFGGRCTCSYNFPGDFFDHCSSSPDVFSVSDCMENEAMIMEHMTTICVNSPNGAPTVPSDFDYDFTPTSSLSTTEATGISTGNVSTGSPTPSAFSGDDRSVLDVMDETGTFSEQDRTGTTLFDGISGPGSETCNDHHQGPGWFHYLRFLFVGMFIIPLLIMVYCYARIVQQLLRTKAAQQTKVWTHHGKEESVTLQRERRKPSVASQKANRKIFRVNITCISLVIIFVVCWLPFHSYHMARIVGIHQSEEFCNNLLKGVSLLIFLNSAINPVLYNFIGTKFNHRFRKAASTMRSSVRKSSNVSSRGMIPMKFTKKRHGSRNSSRMATVETTMNKSSSISNGQTGNPNCSMIAMPRSEEE